MKNLVSVIIPAYNREWSLAKTIKSVFEQTYRPIECIIVDDGSEDGTFELAKSLAVEAPERIDCLVFTKENGGANSARNLGLSKCKGDYICFLDSDDQLVTDSVEARVRILIEDHEVDFSYGLASIVDENGNELREMNAPWPSDGKARIVPYLFNTNSPLIRRRYCELAGGWRNDDTHGQEYEYFARLKFHARKAVFLDRVLSLYLHHSNESILDFKNPAFCRAFYRILFPVKALITFSDHDSVAERAALATEFRRAAKQFYGIQYFKSAVSALQEAQLLKWSPKVTLQKVVLSIMALFQRGENQ